MAVGMRMLLVILPEQVIAVVISIWGSDDRMDALPIHFLRVDGKTAQSYR